MGLEDEVSKDDVILDAKGEIVDNSRDSEDDAEDTSDDEDQKVKASDDSADEESHADGDTDEERAAKTERNRQRRKENKERRKEHIDSLRRELASRDELLNDALARLNAVERRTQSTDVAAVDTEIKRTADAYNYFKGQIQLAVQEQNGAVVADATEKMLQAQRRYDQLNNIKRAVTKQAQTPAPLDPRLKSHAEGWLAENSWYDPQAKDIDSRLTREIDKSLAEEGWNPTTPQYWEELSARIKKHLPHRANQGYNKSTSKSRTTPVAGSGREGQGNSNPSGSYRLSAERVTALKEAGVWDDPAKRADAVKRFKEFDRASQGHR